MHLLLFLAAFVSAAFGMLMLAFGGTHFFAPLAANPLVMAAVTWLLGAALLLVLGVIAARIRRLADALDAQRLPALLPTPAPPVSPPSQPDAEALPVAGEPEPAVALHPITEPESVAAPEPVAVPQPVAGPQPASASQPAPAPQPASELQPVPPSQPAPTPPVEPLHVAPADLAGIVPSRAAPSAAPPVEVEPVAPAPVTSWPRVDPSDRIVPADHRAPIPPLAGSAPEVSIGADEVVAPAAAPAAPPSVLKSGVVDGMAYTLYSDGSVEAELPVGIVHFASISEWRAHMQAQA
jgi:hypothetical protein